MKNYTTLFGRLNPFNRNYKEVFEEKNGWVRYYDFYRNCNMGESAMPKYLFYLIFPFKYV